MSVVVDKRELKYRAWAMEKVDLLIAEPKHWAGLFPKEKKACLNWRARFRESEKYSLTEPERNFLRRMLQRLGLATKRAPWRKKPKVSRGTPMQPGGWQHAPGSPMPKAPPLRRPATTETHDPVVGVSGVSA